MRTPLSPPECFDRKQLVSPSPRKQSAECTIPTLLLRRPSQTSLKGANVGQSSTAHRTGQYLPALPEYRRQVSRGSGRYTAPGHGRRNLTRLVDGVSSDRKARSLRQRFDRTLCAIDNLCRYEPLERQELFQWDRQYFLGSKRAAHEGAAVA